MKSQVLILTCLLMCLAILASPAFAYDYRGYPNFAGDSYAVAVEDLAKSSSTTWWASIESYMTPEVYIDAIGWTGWTFQDICGGVPVDTWNQSSYTAFGYSVWDVGYDDVDSCPYSYQGRVFGTHDFKEGGSTWQPSIDTTENL